MVAAPGGGGPPGKAQTRDLFAGLAGPEYSRRAALLSLGQEPRWHDMLVRRMPQGPQAHVLDVATGTGAVAERLLRDRGVRVTGIDQSPHMLAAASLRLADEVRAGRLTLIEAEAERLPFADGSFDGLTVTYVWRYVEDLSALLAELVRVLRPGAPFASLEFGVPPRALPRAAWRLYTGAVLPAAGAVVGGPRWWGVGRFLHRSIPGLYARHPLPALLDMHRAAGLVDLRVRRPSFGGAVIVEGRRRG